MACSALADMKRWRARRQELVEPARVRGRAPRGRQRHVQEPSRHEPVAVPDPATEQGHGVRTLEGPATLVLTAAPLLFVAFAVVSLSRGPPARASTWTTSGLVTKAGQRSWELNGLSHADRHIEADNRLVWFLGELGRRFDDRETRHESQRWVPELWERSVGQATLSRPRRRWA